MDFAESGTNNKGDGLTRSERRALALERQWALVAPNASHINGPTATEEYRQLIDRVVEKDAAADVAPVVTRRLRGRADGRFSRWVQGTIAAAVLTGAGLVAVEHATYTETELTSVLGGAQVA